MGNEGQKPTRRHLLKIFGASLLAGEAPHAQTEEARRVAEAVGSFNERIQAERELLGIDRTIGGGGITAFQRKAYKPAISDALARGVYPHGYGGDLRRAVRAFFTEDGNAMPEPGQLERTSDGHLKRRQDTARRDAWRMYLGVPQRYGTFGMSRFKPARSTEDKYYYKINDFLEIVKTGGWRWEDASILSDQEAVRILLDIDTFNESEDRNPDFSGIMGTYTLEKGQDEQGTYVAYYDKWNLEGSPEGEEGLIGQPFEIYDRIYYDPTTLQPLEDRSGQ